LSRSTFSDRNGDTDDQPSGFLQINTTRVSVGTVNVRRSPGDVSELTQSIKERGILEPLLVRPVGSRYELVVGSRRLEAAKALGMKKVPALVRPMSEEEALIVSLMENVQRRDLEPEEEYDGLMRLKRLNPARYSSSERIARAIGKSRQYVEDRIVAVEAVRSIRKAAKSQLEVKQAPTPHERKEGVLPIKHATFLHRAEEAPTVRQLPEERRAKKLTELAETIAELPQPQAERVVEHFVMAPQRPMEEIKKEVGALRAVKLEILLDPRVADALRRAAEDRKTTMEGMASLAIHSWLRQQGYF